ncbi:ammonium transporter [Chitinimonas koreensis]|uniref:ammonium transporter n=1 Tax=Chitinimonas koreensis TaxID=356302 RepID=UPI000422A553|nr:ammonium transporter [Chitinimonas koreensis]QNM97331.1 ammonium transporter [Chitinimonas koreensis]
MSATPGATASFHSPPRHAQRLLRALSTLIAAPATLAAAGPQVVEASRISAGDTAWMISATALVLLMTIPGLACFYAGMVRKKNVLATMTQSFAVCALVSLLWVAIGYSLAFMPGTPWLGSLERLMMEGLVYLKEAGKVSVHHGATTIPESVFAMFQLTFAVITPALIAGAFAERMKFSAMLCFMALWSLLVYAPVAHWVWEPGGWLASMGALDFAGGTVVHINAGAAGLMAAWMLGRREGYGQESFAPHNLALTLIGASLLWVGWFGFNAGSALAADGRAGLALLVTHVGAACAALSWMLAEWLVRGRPSMLGLCSGAVAGLVAITPASGFVDVKGAMAIGAAAGIACYWGATGLKRLLGADDSLDVWGVHGVGGLVGALLTGLLARRSIGGADGDLATQAIAAFAVLGYSLAASAVILKLVDWVVGLRVPAEHELDGLDLAQHGERLE